MSPDWLRMTESESEEYGYSREEPHGPWTCPDCNSDNPECETCGGEGEVYDGEADE